MSVPTPVTTMIIVPESRSTRRPHAIETRARPSAPLTRNHGSPRKWSTVCDRGATHENAMAETMNDPTITPMATSATFPLPMRRPKTPLKMAPARGKRMMAHK